MRDGLGLDVDALQPLLLTTGFVRDCIGFCMHSHPIAAIAVLTASEGIVAPMYTQN